MTTIIKLKKITIDGIEQIELILSNEHQQRTLELILSYEQLGRLLTGMGTEVKIK